MASKQRKTIRWPSSTQAGRTNVLLEEMQTQFRMVVDAVVSLREEIPRQIDGLRQELGGRIDTLEAAVRINSEDIRKNSEDIQRLNESFSQLNTILKTDTPKNVIDNHEQRLQVVERQLGITG